MTERSPEELYRDGLHAAEKGDLTTAADLFRQAADAGHIDACFEFGVCCFCGDGVPADTKKGLALLRRASDAGQTTATAMLVKFYLTECPDDPDGIAFVTDAVRRDCANAAGLLKQVCKNERTCAVTAHYQTILSDLAVTDDDALFCVLQYRMRQDEMEAIRYLEEMTERGCRTACYHLGMCYQDGVIVAKDEAKAWQILSRLDGAE